MTEAIGEDYDPDALAFAGKVATARAASRLAPGAMCTRAQPDWTSR